MAELLNGFFGSVFTREDTSNIPAAEEMETPDMKEVRITLQMVKAKIRNLKQASAAGPDNIGPRILKELEGELAPALLKIFQRFVQFGEVPVEWKTANVTLSSRKGPKQILEIVGQSPSHQSVANCLNPFYGTR
jgi:hypothetical protein